MNDNVIYQAKRFSLSGISDETLYMHFALAIEAILLQAEVIPGSVQY